MIVSRWQPIIQHISTGTALPSSLFIELEKPATFGEMRIDGSSESLSPWLRYDRTLAAPLTPVAEEFGEVGGGDVAVVVEVCRTGFGITRRTRFGARAPGAEQLGEVGGANSTVAVKVRRGARRQ